MDEVQKRLDAFDAELNRLNPARDYEKLYHDALSTIDAQQEVMAHQERQLAKLHAEVKEAYEMLRRISDRLKSLNQRM